jgi:hypothetical protein
MLLWSHCEYLLVERELEREKLVQQSRLVQCWESNQKFSGVVKSFEKLLFAIRKRKQTRVSLSVRQGTQVVSEMSENVSADHCIC